MRRDPAIDADQLEAIAGSCGETQEQIGPRGRQARQGTDRGPSRDLGTGMPTMDLASRFEQYAHNFDRAVDDDDWSRVRAHFCDDAVREEHVPPLISLRQESVEKILNEWRDIAENFDRRFDYRIVIPVGRAKACGNRVTLRWVGAYVIEEAPALLGEETEIAIYEGERTRQLRTTWTPETVERNMAWAAVHGRKIPGLLEYAATLAPKIT